MKRVRLRSKLVKRLSASSGKPTAVRHLFDDRVAEESAPGKVGALDPVRIGTEDEVLYHLGSLLDSVKTAIISLDGEGRVRVFNAVAEMLFNVPRQAVLGKPFGILGRMDYFTESSIRALWERLADAVWAAGAALDLEYDLIRPKGQKRVILYSVYPLGRLPWSVGNGVVLMLEDITRKKEMEEQISDGRKRLQTVFDGITDGIQVVDREFRITAVNRSMTALVGGNVAIGNRCYRSCASSTEVCDECPAVETFRSGQPASVVKRIPRKNKSFSNIGEDRIYEISTFPLLDRGNRVLQVVEYIKDVTERILLAERLEHSRRLAALGEMAARVAHEVRNPLNAITGAAHYLASEYSQDGTIQQFTSLIKRQSDRVEQVASDILHAARPLRLNRTAVDLTAVFEYVFTTLDHAIRAQGIIVRHSSIKEPVIIQADEVQIEQAAINIVKNAIEAMPEGGVLAVETTISADGRWGIATVEDDGCGIRPEEREKVFQAFYTTKAQGTGLGLSIVEGVLKNHGGTIAIEQPSHAGTRITMRLPATTNEISPIAGSEHVRDGIVRVSFAERIRSRRPA
ncbi:MAG: ATP-binding protein [Nitrospirota bacterium]|nr:ATP-binding protein [Nitrospirota bacterium]